MKLTSTHRLRRIIDYRSRSEQGALARGAISEEQKDIPLGTATTKAGSSSQQSDKRAAGVM
jgi:hypothetical protein